MRRSISEKKPEDVLITLSRKGTKWTSSELQQLLNEQIDRKKSLELKKSHAESEVNRLTADRSKNIKQDLEDLRAIFLELRNNVIKLRKQKLPTKLESPDFYQNMETIDELEKAGAYMTVLKFFKSTSDQIDANMETELETEAIELFHRLKRIEIAYLDVTNCSSLQIYGKGVIAHWEAKLKNKLIKDFEELLEAYGWPMRLKTAAPTLETQQKFHRAILNLSRISGSAPPQQEVDSTTSSFTNSDNYKTILPVQIMIAPLRRRFQFHFFSDKPTNQSSRPEWYFSQVKNWLRELIPFVKTYMEGVSLSEIHVSSIIEFVRCISEMLIIKIVSQMEDEIGDGIFVRILEESITYENELGDLVAEVVQSNETLPPFVNTIFSRPEVLSRWLNVEKKACLEKLDEMFESHSAWNKPVIPGPPEIVDLFLAVIRSLTDRFAHLQEAKQRLEFLQLFTDLLEDFHVRCLQMWQSKTEFEDYKSKDVLIDYIMADGLEFVRDTLQEWEYLPFFASLNFAHDTLCEEVNGAGYEESGEILHSVREGIFSNACSLYSCLAEEIHSKWCLKMIERLRDEMHVYATTKWQSFAPSPPESLSEQLLIPIQTLKDISKAMGSSMDPKVSQRWMKKLAVRLDELLINTVVFPNRFSQLAITQLSFDFHSGIFAVFVEKGINLNKSLFFGSMCSALTILSLTTGEAMLLYDTLMTGNFDAHESALAELDISICQSEAIKILRSRFDLYH